MEVVINNEKEFTDYLSKAYPSDKLVHSEISIGNNKDKIIFTYKITFPLSATLLQELRKNIFLLDDFNYEFKKCCFNEELTIPGINSDITFITCDFKDNLVLQNFKRIQTYVDCTFYEGKQINAEDSVFDGKMRFRTCHFKGNVNFRNTTFNNLADFWRCIFYNKTIFYKTDFMDIVVLSAVTFKEDVLFTYSLIEKLLLLRGAKVEKGLDLSLAIISGKLGLFDFVLNDYKTVIAKTEKEYETAVSETAFIPLKNKRETFRILKSNLESQMNLAESLKFKAIEKDALLEELNQEKSFSSLFEKANLLLNRVSNNHGTSYVRAFLFIISVGWFFFYCSLLTTDKYVFNWNISKWEFSEGFKLFIEFLNPIHKFDYIENTKLSSAWFYVFDFLGKTLVGYGIYQFIQAFRKYK